MEYKVSVIIPIYGVEKFISRCVHSLMQQTLKDVEYIFIDDCTPDKSISILSDILSQYPDRLANVKVLHHEQNKGLPAARNTGMAEATGQYVFHCDSDDFLELDMLEIMYNAASKNEVEFVWSDWFLSYENTERYMKQPNFKTPMEALKGMLADAMKYNVWNKLVKRSLYIDNDIHFPSGHSMGEDMTMIRLISCAKNVAYVSKALYHYVKTNSEAMTQSYNERHLKDILFNVNLTLDFLKSKRIYDIEKEKAFFKLNVKLPFLITSDWNSYRLWNSWYPEANKYIMFNNYLSLRTRVLQEMASKKLYLFVYIYYILVYKIMYKLFYQR